MIDSLNIGKVIYTNLSTDSRIQGILGKRIYPVIAENNAALPFIIYKRDTLTSNGCKDGVYEDNIIFTINIVTEKYSQGVEIANLVRDILEKDMIQYEQMTLEDTTIQGASESYSDDSYIQTLKFNTKIS